MNIRLVAMDLDGTLLNSQKGVSARNRAALLECQRRGVYMVPASGRSFQSVCVFARELGLTGPIVSSNGARLDASPAGPTILEDTFPLALSRRVYEIMLESGIYFVCYGKNTLYQNNLVPGPLAERGVNTPNVKSENDAKVVETVCDRARMEREGLLDPFKYVAFSEDAGALSRLKARLAAETDCALSSSWYDNLEVLTSGAGKGRALTVLAERLGIPREETMAFGDNWNDLPMLEAAGVGVAMGNACAELRGKADLVAPDNDADGVGAVLYERVLKEAIACTSF